MTSTTIPHDPLPDSTLALLAEGYRFISNRCDRYGSDIFATRLMLKRAVCARGQDAAAMFYHPDRFTRSGAMPPTTLRLLQDLGSVQSLYGADHRQRKQMFMRMMRPEQISRLLDISGGIWLDRFRDWEQRERIVLLEEAEDVLCRATCAWAGVPLADDEAALRTAEFSAMVAQAGGVGPRMVQALALRRRSEAWARDIVGRLRDGSIAAPPGSAARIIVEHREPNGELLATDVAAVELINVLRPTVAVGRYIAFTVLALQSYAESRSLIASGDEGLEYFVQEVRRFYPFFPFIGGRVREPFAWHGQDFPPETWVILDIYGTNHDPEIWDAPDAFRPERFRTWDGSAFNFIPQGAGDHVMTHRCPGEWVTIELMKQAARLMATRIQFDLPAQDLRINLRTMPAQPASGLVMTNIRSA